MTRSRAILIAILLFALVHLVVSCGGGSGGSGHSPNGDANPNLSSNELEHENEILRTAGSHNGESNLNSIEPILENQSVRVPNIGQNILNQPNSIVKTIYRHPDPNSLRVSHAIVSDSDYNFRFDGDGTIAVTYDNEFHHQIRQYVEISWMSFGDGGCWFCI